MTVRSFGVRILEEETAATTVEYGLILGLIVLLVVVAISGAANETIGMWNSISSKSATAISGS